MNKEGIEKRIAEIDRIKDDDEIAHGYEDTLYSDFILALSSGEVPLEKAQEYAALILTTNQIEFGRWMA